MLNTRVSSANARIKSVAFVGVLGFCLIAGLTLLFYRGHPTTANNDDCSGYGGTPSLRYAASVPDLKAAQLKCRQQIPKLSISVKYRHYVSLQRKRLEAIDTGVLLASGDDFVPAHFTFQGNIKRGKVRLKGDWTTHLEDKSSWSLRAVLSGDDEIWGRRRLSLQVPKVRGYDVEPLYFEQLTQAGLMPPRTRLVQVEFNGEDWGLMSLEDHFTKELIEVNKRKETIIGRFDESDMWQHFAANGDHGIYDSPYISEFAAFNEKKIRNSPTLRHYNKIAASMVTAWQDGRLSLSQILDMDAYRRFIVITEAWGGWHAFRWHNLRFYLNPYTFKLEPVPYDNGTRLVDISRFVAYLVPVPNSTAHSMVTPPLSELYQDAAILPALETELHTLYTELLSPPNFRTLQNDRKFIAEAFARNEIPMTVDLGQLQRNYDYLMASFSDYFQARDEAQPIPTDPETRNYSSLVKISIYENGKLGLANKVPFDLQIQDIHIVSRYGGKQSLRKQADFPALLPATALRERANAVMIDVPQLDPGDTIEVTVENPNTGQILKEQQEKRFAMLDEQSYTDTSPLLRSPSSAPEWVIVEDTRWIIPAGEWSLPQPLVVPQGKALELQAGAHLKVAADAFLLVRGALNIKGTSSAPVTIDAQGTTPWGGIYVVNAAQRSHWQHVSIRNVRPFQLEQLTLTGALNFYRSDLTLQNVSIENIAAEDGINMIESDFSFTELQMDESISDGIDSDYSTGTIEHSTFSNIGGDAIDTSGSEIAVSNVTLRAVRDKSISAGEASRLRVSNVDIDLVGVGIAAKDYSHVTVDGAKIRNTGLAAIMSYSKKPEYGGAYITASAIDYDDSGEATICQLGSTLILEDAVIEPRNLNVDHLYSEGVMRK